MLWQYHECWKSDDFADVRTYKFHLVFCWQQLKKNNQEAHGPLFGHLSKTAIAYPVLLQQLGHKFDCAIQRLKAIQGSSLE